MDENRLIEIEIKLSHQEHLLEELNRTVYRQQTQIAQLEATCEALARQLKEAPDSSTERNSGNEKPPHY